MRRWAGQLPAPQAYCYSCCCWPSPPALLCCAARASRHCSGWTSLRPCVGVRQTRGGGSSMRALGRHGRVSWACVALTSWLETLLSAANTFCRGRIVIPADALNCCPLRAFRCLPANHTPPGIVPASRSCTRGPKLIAAASTTAGPFLAVSPMRLGIAPAVGVNVVPGSAGAALLCDEASSINFKCHLSPHPGGNICILPWPALCPHRSPPSAACVCLQPWWLPACPHSSCAAAWRAGPGELRSCAGAGR